MKAFEETVDLEIKRLLHHKTYPCIAALQSYTRKDYCLKVYENFGGALHRPDLRTDLLKYIEEYERNLSPYFTFWAVFKDVSNLSEDQFENSMRREMASLPIDGRHFFVVGLHPASSRLSRRFPWPALVLYTFDQFESFKAKNQMVALYQDLWESTQFKGYEYCFDRLS